MWYTEYPAGLTCYFSDPARTVQCDPKGKLVSGQQSGMDCGTSVDLGPVELRAEPEIAAGEIT